MDYLQKPPAIALQGRETFLRQDFGIFLHKCFTAINPGVTFLPNWHIDLIAEYLEACRRREVQRLIINLPPRSLKSLTVSVAWPAFLLGHNPAERIMCASYAASLSFKHSVDCRNLLLMPWYKALFPDLLLAGDQNEKRKFMTTAFGHRIATSVGGSATGEGGNVLIVDDPQNPAQVLGDKTRAVANHWFDHTFSSRLDNKREGVIVVVMQRLHADDLSGHLLEKGGWEHLCLPAVAERMCYYRFGKMEKQRNVGDVLHANREDEVLIMRAKRELGSFAFAAQYQQNPLPLEGGMIKREWFQRYRQPPEAFRRIVQSWDTAIKAANHHDASVCVTLGEYENAMYVLDVMAFRAEYPELRKRFLQYSGQWSPHVILLEDKASGQSLLQDMRRETSLPLIAVRPMQDKVTRFAVASAAIEAGRLFLPVDAAWLAEFETELLGFPHAPHDDQVDALSQYFGWERQHNKHMPGLRRL